MSSRIDIEKLIPLSPSQLSRLKSQYLNNWQWLKAEEVQKYIDHCIVTGRLVKKILNG